MEEDGDFQEFPAAAGERREDFFGPPVRDEQKAVVEAPRDERPGGAVPEAAEQHGGHEVALGAGRAPAVAAEGNVEVIAEPGGEADVPAFPEIARVDGEIGVAEIEHEPEAEHQGQAAGHVGIAGEVAIDLEGEGIDAEQDGEAIGRRTGEGGVGHATDVVGDDDLLEQAPEDEEGAMGDAVVADRAGLLDLGQEVGGAFDGAGDELGEESDVEGEILPAARGRQHAAVDVDDVAHGLERVERDAHGQDDAQQRQRGVEPQRFQQDGQAVREEVEILEEAEDAEVEDGAGGDPALAGAERGGAGEGLPDPVIRGRRERQQEQEAPIPGAVEQIAGGEQQAVLAAVRQKQVEQEDGREEDEECQAVEQHGTG